MNEVRFSESVSVRVPRWRCGPWRWGPSISARLKVSFQASTGFITRVVGHDIPDFERRFAALLKRLRQTLLNRSQGLDRITSKHLRRVETSRIEREQIQSCDPTLRSRATATDTAKGALASTGIFRVPKHEISTRITNLREKNRPPTPLTVAIQRSQALEPLRPVLRRGIDGVKPAEEQVAEPTDATTTSTLSSDHPGTIFRLNQKEISTRLERLRHTESAKIMAGAKLELPDPFDSEEDRRVRR